jgi:cell wall-associated NlpC family hydrolase
MHLSRVRSSTARRRRSRRLVAAGVGAFLLTAPLSVPALAADKAPPAAASADAGTLEDLQRRAAEVQQKFMQAATDYEAAQMRVADSRAKAEEAHNAEAVARTEMEAQQKAVGEYVASMYTMGLSGRHPMLKVVVYGPSRAGDLLHEQQLVNIVGTEQNKALAKAQEAQTRAAEAAAAAAQAEDAAATAASEAEALLTQIQGEAAAVNAELNQQVAASGLSASTAEQEARNQAGLANWQAYLQRLADAGVVAPSAAALNDPTHLPAPLTPLVGVDGKPVVGVATVDAGGQALTVLPAETISAVSNAFGMLGKPYVADQVGPDSYDCSGFTAASWSKAGYALPVGIADQWTKGTRVDKEDAQVGDLVFFADPEAGLQHVGLYLGGGYVLDSSAARFQVGVEELPEGFYSAVRVTLPPPVMPNALPSAGGAVKMKCGAIEAPAGVAGTPQWGGFPNGMIPESVLCKVASVHLLRCDAAAGYTAMAAAYKTQFGSDLCITDSYRSFDLQVLTFQRKPGLAAVPGTSNHGWGLAVDLCGGIDSFGTPQYSWMAANAGRYGFVHPAWAEQGSDREEPWHWEFGRIS